MNREHKWEIGISSGAYYPSLAEAFGVHDIGLSYENDHMGMQFLAYSYHIDDLDRPDEVARRLYSLNLLLNGSLRVAFKEIQTPVTKFTYFIEPNVSGPHYIWAESIEEYPFSTNPQIDQFRLELEDLKTFFPSYILYLSRQSEELRSLLFLCGLISTSSPLENILTWSTLYKIMDCVRHYSNQEGIKMANLVNVAELNKFTAACNNMSILGLNARHGAAGNPPPTRVITNMHDAIDLILGMAHNFAREFVQRKYP